MTADQLAEVLRYDINRRTRYLRMLDLKELAVRLALGGLPIATGGAKASFLTELIQTVMPADSDDTQTDGTRDERLQAVVNKWQCVPFTGTLQPPDPLELTRILHMDVDEAAVQPPATLVPNGPPPGRVLCALGPNCRKSTLMPDPHDPTQTLFSTKCGNWHPDPELQVIMQEVRREYAATSVVPPVPPVPLPVPPALAANPSIIAPIAQAATIQAFIAANRTNRPAAPAVRPEDADLSVIKLPPWVTVDGLLPPVDELEAIVTAYEAAHALQAADIRWHSAATPRARRSYRAGHGGLDPRPYHAHILGIWHACLASITEQLLRAAPTSGSAPPDAVAATVDTVSGHANVVGPSVVPAGNAAGAAVPTAMIAVRYHSDLHQASSIDPVPPHLSVIKLPPAVSPTVVTIDGLPLSVADLAAILDAYDAALALQAADIRGHSAASTHAGHSYRAVHHGLDPESYHAHLIALWHNRLASIAEQLPHVAPTSGSADSAGQLAAPAPADAVAAAVNAVSGDADVVGTSVVPAGNAARADVRADVLVAYQAAYRAVRLGLDPEPCHAHLIRLWQDCLAPIAEQLPHVAPTSASAGSAGRLAAPADAVAATFNAASDDANAVRTSESAVGATAAPTDAVAAGVVVAGVSTSRCTATEWPRWNSTLSRSPAPTVPISPAPTAELTMPPAPTAVPISPAPTAMPISPAPATVPTMPAPAAELPMPLAPTAVPTSPAPAAVSISPAPTAELMPAPAAVPTMPPLPAPAVVSPIPAHELATLDHIHWCADLRAPPKASVPAVAAAARKLGRWPPRNRFKLLDDFPNMVPPPYRRSYASTAAVARPAAHTSTADHVPDPTHADLARLPVADDAADTTAVTTAVHAVAGVAANLPRRSAVSCPPIPTYAQLALLRVQTEVCKAELVQHAASLAIRRTQLVRA